MSQSPSMVTVRIVGGPTASVAWHEGLTGLQAMELAQGKIEPDPNEQFTFAVQFFGAKLGYLVTMINETYDSFISRGGESASPFFYWNFLINNQPATKSVDRTILAGGDEIVFQFEQFSSEKHKNSLVELKHMQQRRPGQAQRR